jgi:hypothetical protein
MLLLAAYTKPPHPIAATTTPAIRRRQAGAVANLDFREEDMSTAIGGAMKLAF